MRAEEYRRPRPPQAERVERPLELGTAPAVRTRRSPRRPEGAIPRAVAEWRSGGVAEWRTRSVDGTRSLVSGVRASLGFWASVVWVWAGCSRPDYGAAEAAASASAAPPTASGVEMIRAGEGEVAALVRDQIKRAAGRGRKVLVYVGATWCEPCQRFHEAAAAGKLDTDFAGVTLLEFDADHDGSRLREAGYRSHYIPLFVRPGADGRASGDQIEGSIKGDGAVAQIAPRLRALLAKP